MSYVIVNDRGEVEFAVNSDRLEAVKNAAERAFPKHTTIYETWDQGRLENPAGGEASAEPPSTDVAMKASGLPWNPSGKVPSLPNAIRVPKTGIGITMAEVTAAYPMTKAGLAKAHADLLEFFPHTDAEYGHKQWRTPASMAANLLRTNTKTKKAIEGAEGVDFIVPPSFAVGVAVLPYTMGPTLSRRPAAKAQAEYDEATKHYELKMPIKFRSLPLVSPSGRMTTVCVGASAACMSTCLVFTGQNAAVKHNDYSKLFTERALFFKPVAFARMMLEAIDKHVAYCKKAGYEPYVRLNVYSDIPWERFFPEIFEWALKRHPHLRFYDYTKVMGRGPLPFPNYDLTFSYSGTERNLEYCRAALRDNQRVAMVFLRKKAAHPKPAEILTDIRMFGDDAASLRRHKDAELVTGQAFLGYPVIDGDLYDMRSLDPAPCIVGLRYKAPQKLKVERPSDFVIDVKHKPSDKFIVRANFVDGQWISTITPAQTGVDKASEINVDRASA